MRLTSRSFLLPKSFFNKGANISAGSSTRMDGGRPHESPMQPSWLRAKGAFYPETTMKKAALFDVADASDIAGGIDHPAILTDFEMHMGTGRAAGAANLGDDLAALHQIADLHQVALIVRVQGDVAVGVADFHGIAITGTPARGGHHTGGHRDHITTGLGGEVHALKIGRAHV